MYVLVSPACSVKGKICSVVSILTLSSRKASHSIALPASGELLFLKLTQGFVFQETGICSQQSLNASFLDVFKHILLTSTPVHQQSHHLSLTWDFPILNTSVNLCILWKAFKWWQKAGIWYTACLTLSFHISSLWSFPTRKFPFPLLYIVHCPQLLLPFLSQMVLFFFFFKGRLSGFIFSSTNHHLNNALSSNDSIAPFIVPNPFKILQQTAPFEITHNYGCK